MFDWMEDLLADGEELLSAVFEQGLFSVGGRSEEAMRLAERYQEAGLEFGGAQLSLLAEELKKSRLKKDWQATEAVKVYSKLWKYLKHCKRGLELARAEAGMEED